MLTSITLQNFKSFGEAQTIPLEPITVLVGPNNSGKSVFMSVGRFVRNCVTTNEANALAVEGGPEFLLHRPPVKSTEITIAWNAASDNYATTFDRNAQVIQESLNIKAQILGASDLYRHQHDRSFWGGRDEQGGKTNARVGLNPLGGLKWELENGIRRKNEETLLNGLAQSRLIKLSLTALQQDAELVAEPVLGSDGGGLAAVLALWRGSDLDKAARLDSFLQQCLPEIKHALVRPASNQKQRLWIQQKDGETFDAAHLSDGVLYFVALAMHVIDAPMHSVIFIEEPEQSIHPRRLALIVDALRTLVQERKCQFVIATHSPTLLNEFRDEPEAILLFRRGEQGTRVKRLSDIPHLANAFQEQLREAEPGRLLADGFFNDASLF